MEGYKGLRIWICIALYIVIISVLIVDASPVSTFKDLNDIRCYCHVATADPKSVTHDFGEISLDEHTNNNIFASHDTPQSGTQPRPTTCHSARQHCKRACATRLDLHVHYEQFTPLGLMLCRQRGTPTPAGVGQHMYATATLNTTICGRHHHNEVKSDALVLHATRGQDRLCCGNTQVVDEKGVTKMRFGWNPDCMAQVYYLA